MPISEPGTEALPVKNEFAVWSNRWATWFTEVWNNGRGWSRSFSAPLAKTWGLIGAHAEDSQTVTVTGAAVGGVVLVSPTAKTAGIIEVGVVTAANVVTVYAQNTTGSGITPGAKVYRVIVLQT